MRLNKRDLEARHEGMDIVSRVANERHALLVARQIATANAQQQLGWICLIEEIGRTDRAGAVQHLEVRARRARVTQRVDVAVQP